MLSIAEQINFSCRDMRVQSIIAAQIVSAKATEEAAFVGPEGPSLHLAYADRSVHTAVVPVVNGGDRYLSCSDFDVLVALDLFHPDLTCKHADTQVCSSGNLDLDLEAIVAAL